MCIGSAIGIFIIMIFRLSICQNWSEMVPDGSGMVPDHSQTPLEYFWDLLSENVKNMSKSHDMSRGRKTDSLWGIIKTKRTRIDMM